MILPKSTLCELKKQLLKGSSIHQQERAKIPAELSAPQPNPIDWRKGEKTSETHYNKHTAFSFVL